MKFDPLFKSENNKLVKIDGNQLFDLSGVKEIPAEQAVPGKTAVPAPGSVTAVKLLWSQVELSDGNYNEELLASLREFLKQMEEAGSFAFIVPVADKAIDDADAADSFIKAMVHSARRIKDAVSVIGFSMASEFVKKDTETGFTPESYCQWFVNEMNIKHGHYVYFVSKSDIQQNGMDAKVSDSNFILY